jgi:hypothetical protein
MKDGTYVQDNKNENKKVPIKDPCEREQMGERGEERTPKKGT